MTEWQPVVVDGRVTGYTRNLIVDGRLQVDAFCPDAIDGYRIDSRPAVPIEPIP